MSATSRSTLTSSPPEVPAATGSGREIDRTAHPASNRLWSIPNALSGFRLIGSFVLIGLAVAGQPMSVLVLFIVLELTDWFDGRLAVALNQRTVFGARLDSAADVSLAGATLFAGLWLHWTALQPEFIYIAAAVGLYGISAIYGLYKFGSFPSYHTYAAKKCWGLITIGVVCVFAGWVTWPFRVAVIAVTLTNLEAILITRVLDQPRVDVTSLYHVLKERRRQAASPS